MNKNNDDKDIAYELRVLSKRQDLPNDVIRTISQAYAEIVKLQKKLKETQKELSNYALDRISEFDEENGLI
jgi:acyl-[acyl carrier protein]--UDP-N-acetylglucosamine O-acyltransferase